MDYIENWVKTHEPTEGISFDFFLTYFIYPIKQPIVLSEKLGLTLDNLRSPAEIEFFLNEFAAATESLSETKPLPPDFKNPNLFFRETISGIDPNVEASYKDFNIEDSALQIVKMLVVLRFNPQINAEQIKKQHRLSILNLNLNGEEIDGDQFVIEMNRENAIKFSYLLSLLVHRRGNYFEGDTFLTENPIEYYFKGKELREKLQEIVATWVRGTAAIKKYLSENTDLNQMVSHDWALFHIHEGSIVNNCRGFEFLMANGREEQLLYIGELIKQSSLISDEKSKLIALVSAIELLLTHNPDHNRFNVEDSITKQFVLKTAILIYKKDKRKKIELLGSRLKEIYTQRSNIAHGNFKEFNKFLASLAKRSGDDQFFVSLIEDCYWYLRLIVEEYILDMEYIDFLKKQ